MLVLKAAIILAHLMVVCLMILPIAWQKLTFWWLDNLINLQLQWSILALLLILLSLKYLQQLVIPFSLLYLVVITYNFAPFYKIEGHKEKSKEILNIAQLNIQYGNPGIDDLVVELGQSNYDVILLQEVGDNEHEKINKLIDYYPYSAGAGYLENYPSGMALFSRWPLVARKTHNLGYVGGNIIEVIIQSPENAIPIHLFALHPGAPRNKTLWQLRNSTLDYVAQQVSASRLPYKIVIGDINTSPWSPAFKSLENTGVLQNSARGFGYIPSWAPGSTNKLIRWIISAYIDHCLVSSSFKIINKEYKTINGSDHVLIATVLGFE